jgi:nucleotide-binding universal stress UspA family protein
MIILTARPDLYHGKQPSDSLFFKKNMKRILVPCDFSEPALEAYHFATNIAAKAHAEVFVLKVIDLPFAYETAFGAVPYSFDPAIIKEIMDGAKNDFERMKESYPSQEQVEFTTLQGPVTPTILTFMSENKIDLVIMGTHGASGWTKLLIGSNTEKMVRLSKMPVLAVRKSFELNAIRNIAFPTTLELDQPHFVNEVKELQSFFSATLHLLLVNTPYNMRRTVDETERMEEFAKHYKLANYTLNTRNDFNEQDGIINFVHETKADLIAMGTHGRRGLAHLFTGSVTEAVVNRVTCPIWACSIK